MKGRQLFGELAPIGGQSLAGGDGRRRRLKAALDVGAKAHRFGETKDLRGIFAGVERRLVEAVGERFAQCGAHLLRELLEPHLHRGADAHRTRQWDELALGGVDGANVGVVGVERDSIDALFWGEEAG